MKKINKLINLILIAVFSFSVYKLASNYYSYKRADDVYDELYKFKSNVIDNNNQKKGNETINTILDLSYLNEDYVAWITIENSNIDYPILQSSDNDYYLSRDIYDEYLTAGSLVLDYRNSGFTDYNTVIYGHSMKNDTMFGQLKYYKNEEFYRENKYIYIYTKDGLTLKYEIFAAYITNTADDYIKTNFSNEEEYNFFLNGIKSKSLFTSEIEVESLDKIITLSTCSFEYEDARMVVHGKLIEEY